MITETKINMQTVDQVLDGVREVFEKHGMTVTFERTKYSPASLTFTAEGVTAGKEANDKATWDMYCKVFGLKPEHFGKTVTIGGKPYKIVGISPNRPKNCISIQSRTGKVFICSPAALRLVGQP